MKSRCLVTLVVSSIMIASTVFAANDASFKKSHLLDSKNTRATTQVLLEAESASLAGPMKISPEGQAFNNLCINGYKVNRRGWATFTFNIPRDGEYVIWGRIKGRDGYANSFFVSVDAAPEIVWDVTKNNRWEWDRVSDRGVGSTNTPEIDPLTFQFEAGEHTIVIGNREKETLLDQLIITDDLERHFYTKPDQWIELDTPGMGDVIAPGSTVEFKWRSQSISDKVDIDLSFDRGATFSIPVVRDTENDGSYLCNMPAHFNRAKVIARISDSAGTAYDTNWGLFAIVDPSLPSLTLRHPFGGEILYAGTIHLIRWKEHAFNGLVTISRSMDYGTTWKVIADQKNASGEYEWLVPNTPNEECLIKVADYRDGEPFDVCASPFVIKPALLILDAGASFNLSGITALPEEFTLEQNYPNPFNPLTTLNYGVAEEAHVTVSIYDALGRQVDVLVDGQMEPGWYQVVWNGSEFPTGVYTAVFKAGSKRFIKSMSLIK
jgi:hypothetical protein